MKIREIYERLNISSLIPQIDTEIYISEIRKISEICDKFAAPAAVAKLVDALL